MGNVREKARAVFSSVKRRLPGKADSTKLLLAAVFLALVFIPIIVMFTNIDSESIKAVVNSHNFGESIKNSIVSSTIATVITIVIAYALAVCLERINIRFRNIFTIILMLPMLTPSISNGMGLVLLFGNNGILTKLFGIEGNIYGLSGIVMGSVLYAFPVAFLMFSDVIRYEDSSPYEAADVLGLSKLHKFKAITFPYLRKPLISVIFATFTLIITDYGVPLMVGGKYVTLPVVMYQEVIGQLNFGKGAVYGSILLLPAVIAFVIDLLNKDKGNSSFVIKPHQRSNGRLQKAFSYVGCTAVCVFVILPIATFVMLAFSKDYPNELAITFDNFLKAEKLRAFEYLSNSVLIAFVTATIGVMIAFMAAYLSARMKSKVSRFLHLSAITSAAIPGIVLGLAYVLTFKGTAIYGTLLILIMVNMIHFMSSPYLMIYNTLSKINENIEPVAHTMGINRLHMIKDIFVPQCIGTMLEMFSYFFVNCMMTISAVSFLATTSTKPISLMINQFEAQMQLECAAVVSLLILGVNLLVKGVFHIAKNVYKNKKINAKEMR